jgi:hypothetical protein
VRLKPWAWVRVAKATQLGEDEQARYEGNERLEAAAAKLVEFLDANVCADERRKEVALEVRHRLDSKPLSTFIGRDLPLLQRLG